MKEFNCRICGYDNFPEEFWENNYPTYIICPCCGGESGNEDYSIESVKKYRKKWIESGAEWFHKKCKPENWNLSNQLQQIPKRYN